MRVPAVFSMYLGVSGATKKQLGVNRGYLGCSAASCKLNKILNKFKLKHLEQDRTVFGVHVDGISGVSGGKSGWVSEKRLRVSRGIWEHLAAVECIWREANCILGFLRVSGCIRDSLSIQRAMRRYLGSN